MKKGFTLIELLAVIVILALIALIVTPVITNIIDDAKSSVEERSVEQYINAVELSITNYQLKQPVIPGAYTIKDEGKRIELKTNSNTVSLPINYSGSSLDNGIIYIDKNGKTTLKIGSIKNVKKVYTYIIDKKISSLSAENGLYDNENKIKYI